MALNKVVMTTEMKSHPWTGCFPYQTQLLFTYLISSISYWNELKIKLDSSFECIMYMTVSRMSITEN